MLGKKDFIDLYSSKLYENIYSELDLELKKDPQFTKLLESYSIINASVNFDLHEKFKSEITSIKDNLIGFQEAPTGIVSIKSNVNYTLPKDTIIRSNSSIYITNYDTKISNIQINSINNNHNSIEIELTGDFSDIDQFDLLFNNEITNTIFKNQTKSTCNIYKENDCEILLIENKITRFKYKKHKKNQIIITLPNTNSEKIQYAISNPIIISNKFISNIPIENYNIKEENHIIEILEVYDSNNNKIQSKTENPNGWFISQSNINVKYGYIKAICCNKNLDNIDENCYFDSFIPGKISWFKKPKFNQSNFSIDFLSMNITEKIQYILKEKVIVEINQFIHKKRVLNNQIIPVLSNKVTIKTNSNNFIQFRKLEKTLKKYHEIELFIDINGEIYKI